MNKGNPLYSQGWSCEGWKYILSALYDSFFKKLNVAYVTVIVEKYYDTD